MLLLGAVMAGFVLTSVVASRTSAEVASLSETIASTSSPSVERLAQLRTLIFEVELNLSDYLRTQAAGEKERAAFETSLQSLRQMSATNHAQPLLEGELSYWSATQAALIRFEAAVQESAEHARRGDLAGAETKFSTSVRDAGEQLAVSSLAEIEFHAQASQQMANRIRDSRRRANVLSIVLSSVCVALGVVGLLLILRQSRAHRALVEAHSRFHEARADELEQFAARVAHDIRNPLAAASMASQLALRRAENDASKDLLERVVRGLARADSITTGLLEFARSGAHPEPGATATPSELLADFVSGVKPDADQRGIQVNLHPVPPVMVASSSGVYLSLVGNLVRNAMKYMGDRPTKRITIRVTKEGTHVRTEVTDTGPGIAPENLSRLFEPYFRLGADRGHEGLGLGLATVKKLVEGHHGAVGATSQRGKGSTFWFTLPRAEPEPQR